MELVWPAERYLPGANGGVLVERFTNLPQYGGGDELRFRIDLG